MQRGARSRAHQCERSRPDGKKGWKREEGEIERRIHGVDPTVGGSVRIIPVPLIRPCYRRCPALLVPWPAARTPPLLSIRSVLYHEISQFLVHPSSLLSIHLDTSQRAPDLDVKPCQCEKDAVDPRRSYREGSLRVLSLQKHSKIRHLGCWNFTGHAVEGVRTEISRPVIAEPSVSVDVREFLIRLVTAGDTAVARPHAAKGYAQGLLNNVFLSYPSHQMEFLQCGTQEAPTLKFPTQGRVKFLKDVMHEFINQNNGGALASKWVDNIMEGPEVLKIDQQQQEVSNSERHSPGFGEERYDRGVRVKIQNLPEKIILDRIQFFDVNIFTVRRDFASMNERTVNSRHLFRDNLMGQQDKFVLLGGTSPVDQEAKGDSVTDEKQQEVLNLKRHNPDFDAEYRRDGTRVNIRYLPETVNLKREHFLDVNMFTAGRNLASTDELTVRAGHVKVYELCPDLQHTPCVTDGDVIIGPQQVRWSQTRSVCSHYASSLNPGSSGHPIVGNYLNLFDILSVGK
ncbi:hypothetical protein B0H11DRAFT_2202178 [Mycena galericulata]|nr:hypothetical protein B0H11DRAFT_2202178 [Mycena galericulata]